MKFGIIGYGRMGKTYHDVLKTMNIDISQHEFANIFEKLTKFGSVDFELNKNINLIQNNLSITPPNNKDLNKALNTQKTFWEMRKYIKDYFSEFCWEPMKLENSCNNKPNQISGEIINLIINQIYIARTKQTLLFFDIGPPPEKKYSSSYVTNK